MTLKISVEFGGDNLSEQLNRRYTGIVEIGIYQGFKVEPVPGQMKLKISRDGFEVSTAVIKFGEFTLFATDNEDAEINISSAGILTTKLIVIDAKYQWGVTRPVIYRVINEVEKEPHHLELCRILIPANETNSSNFTFNLAARDIALKVADLPPLLLAETQQRGEGDKIKYERHRSSLRDLLGQALFFDDSFKLEAIPPTMVDACEDNTGWSGDGSIVVNSGSLIFSGHSAESSAVKTLASVLNLSLKNGLIVTVSGNNGSDLGFFIEDSLARRNIWNINNTTAPVDYELLFAAPTVNGSCNTADIKRYGITGLNSGVIYTLDQIRAARFNDFTLKSGKAYIGGLLADSASDTAYSNHQNAYNSIYGLIPGVVIPLLPPPSGARTDYVYLDSYLAGNLNTLTPFITVKVDTAANLTNYVDLYDRRHYLTKIATIERSPANLITAAVLTDLRSIYTSSDPLGFVRKIVADAAAILNNKIDTTVQGLDPQASVINNVNFVTGEPPAPVNGNRYISLATGTSNVTATPVTENYIYQWDTDHWIETVPSIGMYLQNEMTGLFISYNGVDWVSFASFLTHNTLSLLNIGDYQHLTAAEKNTFDALPDQAVPIGGIIGIDPRVDVSKVINPNYWRYCDGSGTFRYQYRDGSESADIAVPNLTDNRFLMGGAAYGIGGSNYLTDHTHSCSIQSVNHTHSGTTGNPSANHSHAVDPPNTTSGPISTNHTHSIDLYYPGGGATSVAYGLGNGAYYSAAGSGTVSANHYHDLNVPNFDSGTVSAWHTHAITTGTNSANHNHTVGTGLEATSTSSLPLYFTVKYFLRRK